MRDNPRAQEAPSAPDNGGTGKEPTPSAPARPPLPKREGVPTGAGGRFSKTTAFTLVEAIVVCAVLLIIAGALVPNLVTVTRSRALKDLEGNLARLPAEARNEAIKTQTPARLRLSGTQLILEQAPTDGAPTPVKAVDLGRDLQAETGNLNGKPTDLGSWQWTAYPDGSTDSGGLEFTEGATQKSLILSATGESQWTNGPLPDQSQDQWPAGQLLQRS